MEILYHQASDFNLNRLVHRTVSFMRVISEEKENLLELYWSFLDNENDHLKVVAIHRFADAARLIPNASEQMFEKYKSMFVDGRLIIGSLLSEGPELAKLLHDRRQEILELMIGQSQKWLDVRASDFMWSMLDFVKHVPESASTVMQIIREWSVSDNERRRSVARCCGRYSRSLKQNTKDVAEILWILCADSTHGVCNEAKKGLVKAMLSWGEISNLGVNALLTFSENEPHTNHASLVRLVAIVYKWIDGTQEGVDHLLSTLREEEIKTVYEEVADNIFWSFMMKSEEKTRLHRLHLMCLKALKPRIFEENGLLMRIDILGSTSNEVALMSTTLASIESWKGIRPRSRALS